MGGVPPTTGSGGMHDRREADADGQRRWGLQCSEMRFRSPPRNCSSVSTVPTRTNTPRCALPFWVAFCAGGRSEDFPTWVLLSPWAGWCSDSSTVMLLGHVVVVVVLMGASLASSLP